MGDLPELARDVAEEATQRAKTLVPWLPTPHTCEACNTLCDPSVTWDPQLCEPVKSWVCPECESAFRRVEPWDR